MKQIILVFAIALALAFPISADQAGAGIRSAVMHDIQAVFSHEAAAPDQVIPANCPFFKAAPDAARGVDA